MLLDKKAMSTKCLLTPHPKEWLRIHPDNMKIESLEELEKAKKKIKTWGVEVFYKTASPFTLGNSALVLLTLRPMLVLGKLEQEIY